MVRTLAWLGALALVLPLAAAESQRPDLLIADFEGETYGDWKATGDAFGAGPARGTLPGQMAVSGFQGKGLVNSFHQGDRSTGTLTSPNFKIERDYLRFLIGGGGWQGKTCMNLLIDGKVVRTTTGPNVKPGGSEMLAPDAWDVKEFAGKTAHIMIVDEERGGWGHINVDQIVQTDRKPPKLLADRKREIKIEKRYLHFPIKEGGARRKVTLLVDGQPVVKNDIELADGAPDWWAFVDATSWRGKTIAVQVDRLPEDSKALEAIYAADEIWGLETLYREPLRPQFHFSSRRGWNNDPNGMVFFNGEYHLFYQHNPYGWKWGNMHWGHAVSRDMVRWEELGDALAPDDFGPMFSGSAVVDFKNSSGLGSDGRPPLVMAYTAAGNPTVQCIASSVDGRNFTKFAGNPILKEITGGNRDPKVFWHEPSKSWILVLYVGLPGKSDKLDKKGRPAAIHTMHLFRSPDLKNWTLTSQVEGFYECPDFFELAVDGDSAKRKWVLTAASSEYILGSFDGFKFTPESEKLKGHRGRGFYAAQTFNEIPASDGRRIQIGWLQAPSPGMPFNQAMSMPLELRLLSTAEGPRMTWTPVREMETLRAAAHRIDPRELSPGDANPLGKISGELIELRAEFEPGNASEVAFVVRGATIVYDAKKEELLVNGHRAPAPLRNGKQQIAIYCDRTALEVFAADGLTYVPMPFIPKAEDRGLAVESKGGKAKITLLAVYELKSAWARP